MRSDDRHAPSVEPSSPGRFRRAAAGAWHVPAGLGFLLRHASLWHLAVLPALLAAACLIAGGIFGLLAAPRIEAVLARWIDRLPPGIDFLLTIGLWVGILLAGMFMGLALALVLAGPILERLSRRVERLRTGRVISLERGWRWEVGQSLQSGAYFLAAALATLLLGLIPLVGPFLGLVWGAHAVAFQQTEAPLSRRGLDFADRRRWHRRRRAESLGYGLAGLVTLLVPLANLLLAPALTVGATLLVIELAEDDGT